MGNLSIKKLDDDIIARLRLRAARRGVSMEEEVRSILRTAVSGPERLGDLATELFGPNHGVDLDSPW
jgi:plasmid stability protein